MNIGRRVDLATNEILDVRFLAKQLKGQYNNVYITFTTIEEVADAWADQGDFFLHIPLSPEAVLNHEPIDYKALIIEHLPMIEGTDTQELIDFVNKRLQTNQVAD